MGSEQNQVLTCKARNACWECNQLKGHTGLHKYVSKLFYYEWPQTAEELDYPAAKPAAEPMLGIGGAPTRATTLPTTAAERKQYPVASGFLDYFPDAVAAISHLSYVGNEQHNPGQPLHWARGKSADEADTMLRHFLQRGTVDTDGIRHSVKMCWRALAFLQKELEASIVQEK
jgi:hypothetical protein